MVVKLSEKEFKNRETIAQAMAGLQDGTYKTAYEASKATGAPIRRLYRRVKSPKPDLAPSTTELPSCLFSNIPDTPSKLDSTSLRAANTTLLQMVNASNLDTPTKQYVSRLTSLVENLQARYTASERRFEEISKIVKRRRKHSTGKRVALKDQIVLTTPEMYAKINIAENATRRKPQKTARDSVPEAMAEDENHVEDQIHFNENADAFDMEDGRELEW